MTDQTSDQTGEIRLSGSRAFITAALDRIGRVLNLSYDGNARPNRNGDGYRAYAHVLPQQEDAPSPLEQADAAKRRRDITGEIGALTAADQELNAQPWYPLQPGDVVHWSIPMPDGGTYGQTLLAVDDPDWYTTDGAPLRIISQTPDEDGAPAALPDTYVEFYALWFEAGPQRVKVVRYGQKVH